MEFAAGILAIAATVVIVVYYWYVVKRPRK